MRWQLDPSLTLSASATNHDLRLVEASGTCAIVEVTRRFDGVHDPQRAPIDLVVELQRAQPSALNPTGWLTRQSWHLGEELSCASP